MKKFIINFLLILAGICFTILLAEVFVRIFYPESRDHVLPSGLYESDNYLGWKLAKEKSDVHHSTYFNVNYTTNSFGYRDQNRFVEKGKGKYRILLYGDSQIFGWGVPAGKRFTNLLEDSLKNIEIWNLGVPGYGLDQEVLSYQRDGKFFNADAIIFYISEYTLDRINYEYIYKKYKPKFVITNGELKLVSPKKNGVIKSYINNLTKWMYLPFFIEKRFSIFNKKLNVEGSFNSLIFSESKGGLSELEEKLILLAKDLTESKNDFMIILFNKCYPKSIALKDFCKRNNIIYFPVDFDEKDNNFIHSAEDGHWNRRANEIILRQLLSHVKQLTSSKRSESFLQKTLYNNTSNLR